MKRSFYFSLKSKLNSLNGNLIIHQMRENKNFIPPHKILKTKPRGPEKNVFLRYVTVNARHSKRVFLCIVKTTLTCVIIVFYKAENLKNTLKCAIIKSESRRICVIQNLLPLLINAVYALYKYIVTETTSYE